MGNPKPTTARLLPRALLAWLCAALVLTGCTAGTADPGAATASPPPAATATRLVATPLVIGHRGAPGYRPEHTLASYELAARMGADYIEPDLVSTRDHVLVARHENEISGTTDVAHHPEFASRRTTKVVDGVRETGWFTEDFTLAELETLHARERIPAVRPQNTRFDDRYRVPTFAQVLALRARLSAELHRTIGIAPETKHPTYFRGLGLDLETPLVAQLRAAGLDRPNAPVLVQSFELTNLRQLRSRDHLKAPTLLLTATGGAPWDLKVAGDPRTFATLTSPAGLASLKGVVNAIGPDKAQVIPRRDGGLGSPTHLVADAHRAGLLVLPYTFRAENQFLPADLRRGSAPDARGDEVSEDLAFLRAGVDGFFTDQADIGVAARRQLLATP
ncbi:glycerophosphodiester phosphodiesterase family protein [Oryzihumus sp.]